jgi:hypothetical protein
MNFFGLLLGFATLIIIGLGFVWVIRSEYYLGYLWWPYIMGLGVLIVIGIPVCVLDWGSALLGILGASLIWGQPNLKNRQYAPRSVGIRLTQPKPRTTVCRND